MIYFDYQADIGKHVSSIEGPHSCYISIQRQLTVCYIRDPALKVQSTQSSHVALLSENFQVSESVDHIQAVIISLKGTLNWFTSF